MTELRVTGDLATDTGWRGHSPGGIGYTMRVRAGTSDWNTVAACAWPHDEYSLPMGLSGWALDIGAHIGGATIPLLLDNPGLRVIAVEALPENADLLAANADLNQVADRLTLVRGGASDSARPIRIHYAPDDAQHEYIGNQWGPQDRPAIEVPGITLGMLAAMRGFDAAAPFVWTKIDCEGCEYHVLDSPGIRLLEVIVGEVHLGWQRLLDILAPTHEVAGEGKDFGHFKAALRG
jgi:FkbM family methyltransferase